MSSSWDPHQYEKFKRERELPFHDLLKLIQVEPFENAVDLGCGTGEMTKLFHQQFHLKNTLGLDNSETMLKKAHAFAGGGLSFKKGSIEEFRGQDLDVIISNAALHWCKNHPALFQQLYASLKTGGQLAVQMPANHDYPTHTLALKMDHELFGAEVSHSILSLSEYAKLLYSLGFKEQSVQMKVYGHVLADREAVVEWVKGSLLTAFEQQLSPTAFADFLNDYRERLFELLPDEEPFFYPFKRIFLWARK